MTTTYTWSINKLDAYPEHEGNQNVVFVVHWSRLAADGVNTVSAYGTQSITYNGSEPFTPYADLTKEQIENWLESAMTAAEPANGKRRVRQTLAELDANLAKQLEDLANPPIVSPALPWG